MVRNCTRQALRGSLLRNVLAAAALVGSSLLAPPVRGQQPGTAVTVAGGPQGGFSGDNGPASKAEINGPWELALDPQGNLYFAGDNRIRRIDAVTGIITTVAGGGTKALKQAAGGKATDALFHNVNGVALDPQGNLYVVPTDDKLIWKVDPDGTLTLVAGGGSKAPAEAEGGPATDAKLIVPSFATTDAQGNLLFSDGGADSPLLPNMLGLVRQVAQGAGTITTAAGGGSEFGDGGPADQAALGNPDGIAFDAQGNLYIADLLDYRIRKVDAVTRVITTVAGTGISGFAGDGGPATEAQMSEFLGGVAADSRGNLFIADSVNHRVRKVDAATGIITTVFGGGTIATSKAKGVPATEVSLDFPVGLAIDAQGDLYVTTTGALDVAAGEQWIWKVFGVAAPGLFAGKPFPGTSLPGDVNGDGRVTVSDATLALEIAVQVLTPTDAQRKAADLDGNGQVDTRDVLLLLRRAIGL